MVKSLQGCGKHTVKLGYPIMIWFNLSVMYKKVTSIIDSFVIQTGLLNITYIITKMMQTDIPFNIPYHLV